MALLKKITLTVFSFLLILLDKIFCLLYYKRAKQYRGVAQLVARVLWEHDVGSSSLFTPTTFFRAFSSVG